MSDDQTSPEEAMADYIGCDCDEKDERIAELEERLKCAEDGATHNAKASGATLQRACEAEAKVAELEEAAAMREVTVESQLDRIKMLTADPKTLSGRIAAGLAEIADNCDGMECGPDSCGSCEATKLKRILKGDE